MRWLIPLLVTHILIKSLITKLNYQLSHSFIYSFTLGELAIGRLIGVSSEISKMGSKNVTLFEYNVVGVVWQLFNIMIQSLFGM